MHILLTKEESAENLFHGRRHKWSKHVGRYWNKRAARRNANIACSMRRDIVESACIWRLHIAQWHVEMWPGGKCPHKRRKFDAVADAGIRCADIGDAPASPR